MSDEKKLVEEKRSIVRRLIKSPRQGVVTGTQDGDDIVRLGVIERLFAHFRRQRDN